MKTFVNGDPRKEKNESYRLISNTSQFKRLRKQCIVADNTHVSILLLYISQRCGCEIYFREGTKSSKKGISYHSISSLCQYLETSACDKLPAIQALTGCDYTY